VGKTVCLAAGAKRSGRLVVPDKVILPRGALHVLPTEDRPVADRPARFASVRPPAGRRFRGSSALPELRISTWIMTASCSPR